MPGKKKEAGKEAALPNLRFLHQEEEGEGGGVKKPLTWHVFQTFKDGGKTEKTV